MKLKQITLITSILLISIIGWGQNKQQQDSIAKEQLIVDKFVDSVYSNTSVKVFDLWLDENISKKQYREGKFTDLWNAFIQNKYQLWLQKKRSHELSRGHR